jgi:glutamate racemase
MTSSSQAIGIFDSGIGGLTVAKAVRAQLPGEDIIYVGDTARVPYGIKSEETVKRYAKQIARFLREHQVKLIIIACNTVSATALSEVKEAAGSTPVLDVISTGAQAALQDPLEHRHVGIIGTLATINSHAYHRALHERAPELIITEKACPLLVPLAEEGWLDNAVTRETLTLYLQKFQALQLDRLILGCTHYPLFKPIISEMSGLRGNQLIDSGEVIAQFSEQLLQKRNLLKEQSVSGSFTCYVSDRPQRFGELAKRFLGAPIQPIISREWD